MFIKFKTSVCSIDMTNVLLYNNYIEKKTPRKAGIV